MDLREVKARGEVRALPCMFQAEDDENLMEQACVWEINTRGQGRLADRM